MEGRTACFVARRVPVTDLFAYLWRYKPKDVKTMKRLWNILFGPAAPCGGESCDEAVARARRLLAQGNHEDACRLLRRGERQGHAEAMHSISTRAFLGSVLMATAERAGKGWAKNSA